MIKGPRDVLSTTLMILKPLISPISSGQPPCAHLTPPLSPWHGQILSFRGKIAFVRCLKDHALPLFLQDMFMEKSGVEWNVENIEASHSPYASKPDELANVLGELARQFDE